MNIKACKENWPYRYIISCNQSAIEKLAQWVEFQLKYLPRQHSTYLKDTKHFLKFIEEINEEQGPFKENEIIMVSRDIKNFHPSCETRKCLSAVESVLPNRRFQCLSPDCILEAIEITMSSNSTQFDGRQFTQIDGATIGSPDSGSITDTYEAVHIDQVLIQQCPIVPQNYKRYRNDTIDVCRNSSQEEQECITDRMNKEFGIECIGEEVKFLDTEVNVVNISKEGEEKQFQLVPNMYSKDTDTHQYLSPKSCHPDHIAENIPTTVVHRC